MSALEYLVDLRPCGPCEAGLAHCHGTAIVHRHGRVECSEVSDCSEPEAAHAYVILCIEIDDGCC